MQCYKNGQFIDSIPLLDRAFHYGDGCFTTARIFQENFELKENELYKIEFDTQPNGEIKSVNHQFYF